MVHLYFIHQNKIEFELQNINFNFFLAICKFLKKKY
jgi:hypothetical protein